VIGNAAVPQQLLNKTISISYVYNVTAKSPDGKVFNAPRAESRAIYVSTLGRVFSRLTATRLRGSASKTADRDPGQSNFRYENGALVGRAQAISGAVQITISFDSAFQSCKVDVIVGHENGKSFKWTSLTGEIYEAQGAMTVSGQTC